MLREQLQYKLAERFGVLKGHQKYREIINLLIFTYENINKVGFANDFYKKIFNILIEEDTNEI